MEHDLNISVTHYAPNSPCIYDIYDTNDGDSMTVMTQIRYEGLHLTYMTYQVEIYHPIELSYYFWKLNGLLLKFGEGGRLGKRGHMSIHEHTP